MLLPKKVAKIARVGSVILLAAMTLTGAGCVGLFKSDSAMAAAAAQSALKTDPIRVANITTFQPLRPLQVPTYQGLQSPLMAPGARRFNQPSTQARQLPRLTLVKVLKTNKIYALVELPSGERGFVAEKDLAPESVLFSPTNALKPLPVGPGIDPLTGLPYNTAAPSEMTTVDPLVDQALLNDVDSIKLPESEAAFQAINPEGEVVDGVLLRKPTPKPTPSAKAGN